MVKIDIKNLNYAVGNKCLFNDLNFTVTTGTKTTIVGENGVGKSTLLKMLSGAISDYEGHISLEGLTGYLPQTLEDMEDKCVFDHIIHQAHKPEWQPFSHALYTMPFNTWIQNFNQQGGYTLLKTLGQLKLSPAILQRCFSTLSGGEKIKSHLCALYHLDPSILLLDEPTNHLDSDGIRWLEQYLHGFEGIVVMITHDRALINKTSNQISELSSTHHTFNHFRGNYTAYLEAQTKQHERLKAERQQQDEQLKTWKSQLAQAQSVASASPGKKRTDNNKLGYDAAGNRKQKGQGHLTRQLATKVDVLKENLIKVPKKRHTLAISLNSSPALTPLTVHIQNVCKTIGTTCLFDNINIVLQRKDRLIITGPNGTGKTTLLKILAGLLKPDSGQALYTPHTTIGFLDQEQESIDLNLTAIEFIESQAPLLPLVHRISLLGRFGIHHRHDLGAPLKTLSIGSRRKAQLASIVASNAAILLLDEPTNHMDISSLEKIETELLTFNGIIIAVSHDRYFNDKIATQRLVLG